MAYVTSAELQLELESLAHELGISVQELLAAYATKGYVDGEFASVRLDIQRITEIGELDSESLAEKIIKINEIIGTVPTDVVKSLFDRIAENKVAVAAVATDLAGYKVQIAAEQAAQDLGIQANAGAITNLTTAVNAANAAQGLVNADIEARVTANRTDINTLKGDDTVVGSVAKSVKDGVAVETARAKATEGDLTTLTTDAKGSLVNAVNEVDANADAAKAAADAAALAASGAQTTANSALSAANAAQACCDAKGVLITTLQTEVDNSQAAIGLNEDGTFTPIGTADTLLEYVANVDGDADNIKKALQKLAKKSKQADQALGVRIDGIEDAVEILNGDATVEGSVAKQILDATGGNISDLSGRVTVLETEKARVANILDDKIVDGNLQKGVVTKVADLEAGLIANQADQDAKAAALAADIAALSGSGLVTGVICGKKAANKFRAVFGQTPIAECGVVTPPAGDGNGL